MASGLTLVALGLLTLGGAFATHVVVRQQERRLLVERTREVRLVLTTAVSSLQTGLTGLGANLQSDGDSNAGFSRAAAIEAGTGNTATTYALLGASPTAVRVDAVAGAALRRGQILTGPAAAAARATARGRAMVATPIIGTGAGRSIGFALGGPAAPAGAVLYEQLRLGPVAAPRQASSAPFEEVNVVLYAAPEASGPQVLSSTTTHLPLRGSVAYLPMPVGASQWLLGGQRHPAPGRIPWPPPAPWFVLAIGLLGSVLIALIVRSEAGAGGARRWRCMRASIIWPSRCSAVCCRRCPSSEGWISRRGTSGRRREPAGGGDWFDAFPLDGGRVGVVIGDVMGHDILAAAAMSRSGQRSGRSPGRASARRPCSTGSRRISRRSVSPTWSPSSTGCWKLRTGRRSGLPLCQRRASLADPEAPGRSGRLPRRGPVGRHRAPRAGARSDGTHLVTAGSTLLFFTDGLIEVPGTSLEDSLDQLGVTVTGDGGPERAEELCERVLAAMLTRPAHDDVAMLVVRLVETRPQPPVSEGGVPGVRAGYTWIEGEAAQVAPNVMGDDLRGFRSARTTAGLALRRRRFRGPRPVGDRGHPLRRLGHRLDHRCGRGRRSPSLVPTVLRRAGR